MGKRRSGKPNSGQQPSTARHLQKMGSAMEKTGQLAAQRRQLASPAALLISSTLVPGVIFSLLRQVITVELPQVAEQLTPQQMYKSLQRNMYGDQYAALHAHVDGLFQNFSAAIHTAIGSVQALYAAFNMIFGKRAEGLQIIQQLKASTEIDLAGNTDTAIKQFGEMLDSLMQSLKITIGYNANAGTLNIQTAARDFPAETYNSVVGVYGGMYRLYVEQLNNLLQLIPRGVKLDFVNQADAPYLDFRAREVRLDRIEGPMPGLGELGLIITTLRDSLAQMHIYIADTGSQLSEVTSQGLLAGLDAYTDALAFRYSAGFAIMAAIFMHRFITSRAVNYFWPLRWHTSHNPNPVPELSTITSTDLDRLNRKLDQAIADTNQAAQRNANIANAMYAVFGAMVLGLYLSTGSPFIRNLLIPYLLGLVIDKAIDYGLDQRARSRLTDTMAQRQSDLQDLFPNTTLNAFQYERIEDSCFLLTVTDFDSFTQSDYATMIEATLEKFNITIISSFWDDGKILISANQTIPTAKIKQYVDQLLEKTKAINLLEQQIRHLQLQLPSNTDCYHRTYYDANDFPHCQVVISKTNSEKNNQHLLTAGFREHTDDKLVLNADQPFAEDAFQQLLQDLRQPQAVAVASKAKELEEDNSDFQATADTLSHQPEKTQPDQGEATRHRSTKRQQSAQTPSTSTHISPTDKSEITWQNVCGEALSLSDPRVHRISGHHGNAYIFFRLSESTCGGDTSTYQAFLTKASQVARTRMGTQGIKWYGASKPKTHPDGSVGRVKVTSKLLGDVGLFVYRPASNNPDEPLLYVTDDKLTFGIH